MRRVEFRDSAARRRLLDSLRATQGAGRPLAMRACAFFLFLSLALHGGRIGGSFPRLTDASPEERPREPRSFEASREVEDMRTRTMIGVVGIALAGNHASGADLIVPTKQYPTIQSALDAAHSGDRIVLSSGSYAMSDLVITKAITIESASGCLDTVIAGDPGPGSSMGFTVSGLGPNDTVRISGVTFVRGRGSQVLSGRLIVDRCRFVSSGGPSEFGGALRISGAEVQITRCSFESCTAAGAGAIAAFGTAVSIVDSVFLDNSATWTGGPSEGGAVHMTGSMGSFERCAFIGNSAAIGGAICRWWGNPIVSVSDSQFASNTSDWNCCVSCVGCGTANASQYQVDCNQNGISDLVETLVHPSSDANGDRVPDACQCVADIIRDNAVNAADLAIILVAWGTNGSQYAGADQDGDGVVNGSDLAAVLAAWGPCPQ